MTISNTRKSNVTTIASAEAGSPLRHNVFPIYNPLAPHSSSPKSISQQALCWELCGKWHPLPVAQNLGWKIAALWPIPPAFTPQRGLPAFLPLHTAARALGLPLSNSKKCGEWGSRPVGTVHGPHKDRRHAPACPYLDHGG